MADEDESDLPLHDEAKARSKWRGGETIIDKGSDGSSGPASEVDNAVQSDADGAGGLDDGPIERPPD